MAQAELNSAEHFKSPWVPIWMPASKWEAADADVKSILETLEKECGAILRSVPKAKSN